MTTTATLNPTKRTANVKKSGVARNIGKTITKNRKSTATKITVEPPKATVAKVTKPVAAAITKKYKRGRKTALLAKAGLIAWKAAKHELIIATIDARLAVVAFMDKIQKETGQQVDMAKLLPNKAFFVKMDDNFYYYDRLDFCPPYASDHWNISFKKLKQEIRVLKKCTVPKLTQLWTEKTVGPYYCNQQLKA